MGCGHQVPGAGRIPEGHPSDQDTHLHCHSERSEESAPAGARLGEDGTPTTPRIDQPPASSSCDEGEPLSVVTNDQRLWVPDNPDGSGWVEVDWTSAVRGSRYHYRHGEPRDEALAELPPFYRVVTRLESAELIPHENTYYV